MNYPEASAFLNQFHDDSLEHLRQLSDEELVATFNREVGNRGWTGTRGAYLVALANALRERPLDTSAVFTEGGNLVLRERVRLVNGALAVG